MISPSRIIIKKIITGKDINKRREERGESVKIATQLLFNYSFNKHLTNTVPFIRVTNLFYSKKKKVLFSCIVLILSYTIHSTPFIPLYSACSII